MVRLFPGDGEGHEPDEVLRLVAPAFGHVVIDKIRGDRLVEKSYQELLALGTPEVILQSHRSLFGVSTFVAIGDGDSRVDCVEFILQPGSAIEIEYDHASAEQRRVIDKLASVFGYETGVARPARL